MSKNTPVMFDKGFENVVYNCDCLELMREMERGGVKVDWCIADPPYGIGVGSMTYTNGVNIIGKTGLAKRGDYSNTGSWDNERWTQKYFDLIFKISKNQIIFGGNYYADILPPTKSWIVWDKRCEDKFRNDFADCELAWCSTGQARVFRYLYNGMLQGNMKNKEQRFHPTQKPLEIYYQLLNFYTKEGDLIFDPCAGSFSCPIACYKTKRRFLASELSEEYFNKGQARLNAVKSQLSIFDI